MPPVPEFSVSTALPNLYGTALLPTKRVRRTRGEVSKMSREIITRFCPTPENHLHQGHFYLAILNQEFARQQQGTFYIQIDDLLPFPFVKSEILKILIDDLEWLGLCQPKQVGCCLT